MTLDRAEIFGAKGRTRVPWTRWLLLVDGSFLVAIGVFVSVLADQGHTAGRGPFAEALEGQPYVVGFVEAGLLIAVIGVGLLVPALRTPSRLWHGWAMLAHGTLAGVDLSYMDAMESMRLPATSVVALVLVHAAFSAAHVTALVAGRSTGVEPSAVRPAEQPPG